MYEVGKYNYLEVIIFDFLYKFEDEINILHYNEHKIYKINLNVQVNIRYLLQF